MERARFEVVSRCAKIGRKAVLMCAVCAAAFVWFQSPASASPAASALSALPSRDGTFLYLNFTEADKILSRLQKANVLNFLLPRSKELFLNLPAKEFALLLTEIDGNAENDLELQLQMAMRLDDEYRDLLKKIEKKTAEGDEIMSRLKIGGESGFFFFDITKPDVTKPDQEDQDEFYKLNSLGLYFSAQDDLLILADSPENLKKAISAAKGSSWRFTHKAKVEGRNQIAFSARGDFTSLVRELFTYISGWDTPTDTRDVRFVVEGNVRLFPRGWDLDLFSNVTEIFFGKEYVDRMSVRPKDSFFEAGGGQLLAMADTTPLMSHVASLLEEIFGIYEDDDLLSEFADLDVKMLDRVNAALTTDPENPKDIRAYVRMSSKKEGVIRSFGGAITESLELISDGANANRRAEFGITSIEKIDAGGGRTIYMVKLSDDFPLPSLFKEFSVTIEDEGIILGWMPPSLMSVPFEKYPDLYANLAKKDTMEKWFVDVRGLRKSAAAWAKDKELSFSEARFLAMCIIPFMDFRAFTAEISSPERMHFSFHTGWFDIEERAFLENLMQF